MFRGIIIAGIMSVVMVFLPSAGRCLDVSNSEIMEELKALKARIDVLEEKLKEKDHEIERLKDEQVVHTAPESELDEKELKDGILDKISDLVSIGGLIEVGAAYQGIKNRDGTDEDDSDIDLTTVEIGVEVKVNEWVNAQTVFLYEDPFGNNPEDESDVTLDVGTVTIGNCDEFPFSLTAGKMYVPFGAILTHLPDDPLVEQPMTLLFGETSEKAVLLGYQQNGFNVSGYVFNGDMDEYGSDNTIGDFGFDITYTAPEGNILELLTGVSYMSDIAESDGLSDYITSDDHPIGPLEYIDDPVDGFAAYLHLGINEIFFDAEYMTALSEFDPTEIALGGDNGARPSVLNIETGYNWNWGKNLEIVLKYEGSHETGALGYPHRRYGIGFNQEIMDSLTGSVAYFRDRFHSDDAQGRDDRDILCSQISVEF
jgi:hypothetical protein